MPRNAKQGLGGKHNPSEGARHWREARGSEVTKGSQLAVRPLCILSDPTVSLSTWSAQGKQLWEESTVNQLAAFLLAAMGDLKGQFCFRSQKNLPSGGCSLLVRFPRVGPLSSGRPQ